MSLKRRQQAESGSGTVGMTAMVAVKNRSTKQVRAKVAPDAKGKTLGDSSRTTSSRERKSTLILILATSPCRTRKPSNTAHSST